MNINTKYRRWIEASNQAFGSNIEYKPHQAKGIEWCVQNEKQETSLIKGGFIADEMGLGKTILVLLVCLIHYVPNTLLVVPNSLLYQWRDEIERITGHKCLVYHGPSKKKISKDTLTKCPIVLTTYHTIARNKKLLLEPSPNILHEFHWDRVVFDEAHYLRNKNSLYYGADLLKSKIIWFVSGTPIQNKERDFNNMCAILGTTPFHARVLRRTKQGVGIKLGQIVYDDIMVSWNNEHEKTLAQQAHHMTTHAHDNYGFIVSMQLAKKSCIYSKLLQNGIKYLDMDSLPEVIEYPPSYITENAYEDSSKINSVVDILYQRKNNKNGKLVFCQYKQEISLLQTELKKKGMTSSVVDGSLPAKEKVSMLLHSRLPNGSSIKELPLEINRFINSFLIVDVMILQIQTCCEGLNLQDYYSETYFVSPCWNPSVEKQAIARCHRMGQKKDVHVFRFYMEPFHDNLYPDDTPYTMDQYIHRTQQKKNKIMTAFNKKYS